jgi:hypothetical protein
MSNKQKFRRESEDPIDLADWGLPKLEEKLGSIESLVKETVSEVIQCATLQEWALLNKLHTNMGW